MAIPGQKNINIGQPNQSANSDSLFDAFTTVQNNFTTLFSASSPITSLTAGPGINVSNSSTSSYQIINTGVTSLIAGNNITITSISGTPGSNGSLVISATGGNGSGGGVTSVGVVSNTLSITNTPIVSSGNIRVELSNVANLVAGTYRNPNVTIDTTGRVISIANGVATGVTSVGVIAGNGISISGSPVNGNSGNNTGAGNITVTNTGVTALVAGTGIVLSAPNGVVTISSTGGGGGGTGTVTSVGVTSNTLTVAGSPIVSSGTISVNLPANLTTNVLTANSANVVTVESSNIWVSVQNGIPITTTVYSNTVTGDSLNYRRARGNIAAPQAIQTGDQLVGIRGQGYTAFNQFQPAGGLIVTANGSPATSTSLIPSDVSIAASTTNNSFITFRFLNSGNAVIPGSLTTITAANGSAITTHIASRSRNVVTSPSNIAAGDFIYRMLALGYTGNGLSSVGGITGYSTAGSFEIVADTLPSSNGALIPSNAYIRTVSTSNNVNILNFTSTGNLNIPGVYLGDGGGLSNIVGANVTGAVAFATTANSVAGANVSGAVSFATTANSVAGANVSGAVAFATTANSVAGANVSGTVANATFATSAGSATTAGTVTTAAQPNITSVGTLTSLSVSGTITGNASGLTNIPAANIVGDINNNIAVTATANTTANVGNIVTLTINGVTYQLLAV